MKISTIPLPDPATGGRAVHMHMPAPTSILFRARLALASIPHGDPRTFILAVAGPFTETMLDKNLSGQANHSAGGKVKQGKLAVLNYSDTIKIVRTAKDCRLTIIIEEDVYWSSDAAVALSAAVIRRDTDLIFISDRDVPELLRTLVDNIRSERTFEKVCLDGTVPALPALQRSFTGSMNQWVSLCADEIFAAVRQGRQALIYCEREPGLKIKEGVELRSGYARIQMPGYLHIVNTDAKFVLEQAKNANHPHFLIVGALEPIAVEFENLGLVMVAPGFYRRMFETSSGQVIRRSKLASLIETQLAVEHALLSTLPGAEVKIITPKTDNLPPSPPARFKNEQLLDFCFRFVATFDVEDSQNKNQILNSLGVNPIAFKEAFRRLQISGCFSPDVWTTIDPGTASFMAVADHNTRAARFLASASDQDEHMKRATARIAALLVVSEPRPVLNLGRPVDLDLGREMARNLAPVLDIPAHIFTQGHVWSWLAFWSMWDGIIAIKPNHCPGRTCTLHPGFVMDQHSAAVVRTKVRMIEEMFDLTPGPAFLKLSEEQCRRITVNIMRVFHDQLLDVPSDALTDDRVPRFTSRGETYIDEQSWHAVDANGIRLRPMVVAAHTYRIRGLLNATTLVCGEANLMKDLDPLLYGTPGETLNQKLQKHC